MAGEEKTSSTEAPPGAAWGPSEHSQQHQHRATGVNIIFTNCPRPNEIFVLVQERDVSARRANIVAAGSLGKVINSLYLSFFVCLFVCKTLGSCFKLKHLLSSGKSHRNWKSGKETNWREGREWNGRGGQQRHRKFGAKRHWACG